MTVATGGRPGEDLVLKGLDDHASGRTTVESLLVSIGAPRLRRLGFQVEPRTGEPERELYDLLALDGEDSAHGRYNALVRTLVSFERAAESRAARQGA